MNLRELLLEKIERTGKGDTAVVGWGRGMGHKGHMYLASSVITHAKELGGDPYFVVSRTVGKDDPITPEEKLAIYKKVFPQQGHIFQTASDEMPDLTRVLGNLNQQGYRNAVVIVGADQVKAFQYLKQYNGKPDKAGNVAFTFDNLDVISRQETSDPSRGEEGPRATPMRQVLLDPTKSEQEQFAVWRDAMNPEIGDDEVRDLMNKAKERMIAMQPAPKKTPAKKAAEEKPLAVAEKIVDPVWSSKERNQMRAQGSLPTRPLKSFDDLAAILKITPNLLKNLTAKYPGFPNPSVTPKHGSRYYRFEEVKKWVIENSIKEKIAELKAREVKEENKDSVGDRIAAWVARKITGDKDTAMTPSEREAEKARAKKERDDDAAWVNKERTRRTKDAKKEQLLPPTNPIDRAFLGQWKRDRAVNVAGTIAGAASDTVNALTPKAASTPDQKARAVDWHQKQQYHKHPQPAREESSAMAHTAKRLTDPKDGATAKLRAAGDKRREQQMKGRDIAKRDSSSKDEWGNFKEQLAELSSELLGKYKKAASADATKADKEGNFKRGDKRFSGIVKATNKQFSNDMKKYKK